MASTPTLLPRHKSHRWHWFVWPVVIGLVIVGSYLFAWYRLNRLIETSLASTSNLNTAPSSRALGKIVLALAGWPREKTYLVLFQNSAELRPTGGFIGSFAVVRVAEGRIKDLQVADSYALDKPSENTERPLAPEPLQRWNATPRWYFRDSNWDPDFPTSVARSLQFFYDEQAAGTVTYAQNFDGVIAITPLVAERLLALSGPITVDGITFKSGTFRADLQEYVERDYAKAGVPRSQRKAIIKTAAWQIIKQILTAKEAGLADVTRVFLTGLKDRSVQLWFTDTVLQKMATAAGWSGAVRATAGDFIMLVDANLASLKTDPEVERSIHYQVTETDNGLMARADIDYNHRGAFSFTTTRYRSFTRWLAPAGSELLRVEGAELTDRRDVAGPVFSEKLGDKMSFGAFISIEPGQQHRLSFIYRLPPSVLDRWRAGSYTLIAQKQAGTARYPLSVDLLSRQSVQANVTSGYIVTQSAPTHIQLNGAWGEDEYFGIK